MMTTRLLALLGAAALVACSAAGAGESPAAPASQPAAPPATSAAETRPSLPGIRIDPAARTIELQAFVALREGPLELLLCRRGTKEYESVLTTDVTPSHLHAALLALGLDPGRPAHWLPTPAGDNAYVPPAGAPLEITLRWRDGQGRRQQAPPHQWLIAQPSGRQGAKPFGWVFVGSAPIEEGPYWADQTGDIVSLANYEASIIDVPFASSRDNTRLSFAARPAAIPPAGTPVTVVIRAVEGAERAAVASAVIEIDRFGRYSLEGRPLESREAEEWAEAFRARHARPFIIVLAAPQALAYDIDQLKQALARSRIDDIQVLTRRLSGQMLPRTQEQAARALQTWRNRLNAGPDAAGDPASQAPQTLEQIDRARRELTGVLKVWQNYQHELEQILETGKTPPP